MRTLLASLGLAVVLCAVPDRLRAADNGTFAVRAVAPHVGLTGDEYVLDDGEGNPVTLSLGSEVLLDATALASAEAKGKDGNWVIAVELTAAGKARFAEITERFLNRRLAILINGRVRCAPVVNAAILDGSFEIYGNFTEDEAKRLAADLNAAAPKSGSAATPAATPGSP